MIRLPCGHYLSPVYTVDSILGDVYHCIVDGREFNPAQAELGDLL